MDEPSTESPSLPSIDEQELFGVFPWLRKRQKILAAFTVIVSIIAGAARYAHAVVDYFEWARAEVVEKSNGVQVTLLANDYVGKNRLQASHAIRVRIANLRSEPVAVAKVYLLDWDDKQLFDYTLKEDQLGKPLAPGTSVDLTYSTDFTTHAPESGWRQKPRERRVQHNQLVVVTSQGTMEIPLSSYTIAQPVPDFVKEVAGP